MLLSPTPLGPKTNVLRTQMWLYFIHVWIYSHKSKSPHPSSCPRPWHLLDIWWHLWTQVNGQIWGVCLKKKSKGHVNWTMPSVLHGSRTEVKCIVGQCDDEDLCSLMSKSLVDVVDWSTTSSCLDDWLYINTIFLNLKPSEISPIILHCTCCSQRPTRTQAPLCFWLPDFFYCCTQQRGGSIWSHSTNIYWLLQQRSWVLVIICSSICF